VAAVDAESGTGAGIDADFGLDVRLGAGGLGSVLAADFDRERVDPRNLINASKHAMNWFLISSIGTSAAMLNTNEMTGAWLGGCASGGGS
jgi:hypothetical protein